MLASRRWSSLVVGALGALGSWPRRRRRPPEPAPRSPSTGYWIAAADAPAACAGRAKDVPGGPDGTGTAAGPARTTPACRPERSSPTTRGPCSITDCQHRDRRQDRQLRLGDSSAANVTIRNSKVNGTVILDTDLPGSSAWSLTLQDTEVDGGPVQLSAVGWGNLKVIRSNIHGGQTSVQCEENSLLVPRPGFLSARAVPPGERAMAPRGVPERRRSQHDAAAQLHRLRSARECGQRRLHRQRQPHPELRADQRSADRAQSLRRQRQARPTVRTAAEKSTSRNPRLVQRHLPRTTFSSGAKAENVPPSAPSPTSMYGTAGSVDMQHLGRRRPVAAPDSSGGSRPNVTPI